jgi:hypothetical protein
MSMSTLVHSTRGIQRVHIDVSSLNAPWTALVLNSVMQLRGECSGETNLHTSTKQLKPNSKYSIK